MEEVMRFDEHLNEFKQSMLIVIVPFLVITGFAFIVSKFLIRWMVAFYGLDAVQIVTLTPWESIQTEIRVAVSIGTVFVLPLLIFMLYRFSYTAIPEKIKKQAKIFFIFALLLTIIGLILGLTVFARIILNTMVHYNIYTPMWSIYSIVGFIITITTAMILIPQTIIIMPLIDKLGFNLINLKKYRAFIFVGVLIITGFLTPPDLLSQILLTIPLYGSFEIGLLLCKGGTENGIRDN